MNILTRISRLLKADIHGILDSLEHPEMILQQSVRDMQNEINMAEETISGLDKHQNKLNQKKQSLQTHIGKLKEHLQFCFAENNEPLGKSVIRKKLQTEASLKELSRQIITIAEEKKLKSEQTEMRKEKLQTIRDKLKLFSEKTDFNECSSSTELSSSISQDDVDLAFLYEKQGYVQATSNGEKS